MAGLGTSRLRPAPDCDRPHRPGSVADPGISSRADLVHLRPVNFLPTRRCGCQGGKWFQHRNGPIRGSKNRRGCLSCEMSGLYPMPDFGLSLYSKNWNMNPFWNMEREGDLLKPGAARDARGHEKWGEPEMAQPSPGAGYRRLLSLRVMDRGSRMAVPGGNPLL